MRSVAKLISHYISKRSTKTFSLATLLKKPLRAKTTAIFLSHTIIKSVSFKLLILPHSEVLPMEFYSIDFSERFKRELAETLTDMRNPVEVKVFIASACETCRDTVRLLKLFEEASPKHGDSPLLKVKILNYDNKDNREEFIAENVQRVPTVSLLGGRIKWIGIPAGEEIRALVETILRISENESGLTPRTKKELKAIDKPIHIETIVTPPCPYCPYSVLLAHMFAFEAYKQNNPVFVSEAIEAFENPDIADKYGVMTVPATAINGQLAFVGVPYEEDLLEFVRSVAEGKAKRHRNHWHL